jgi:hypothetical protein
MQQNERSYVAVVQLTGVVGTVHNGADREGQRHPELGSNRTSASYRKHNPDFKNRRKNSVMHPEPLGTALFGRSGSAITARQTTLKTPTKQTHLIANV